MRDDELRRRRDAVARQLYALYGMPNPALAEALAPAVREVRDWDPPAEWEGPIGAVEWTGLANVAAALRGWDCVEVYNPDRDRVVFVPEQCLR